MNSIRLEISRGVLKLVQQLLVARQLPYQDFLGWKQALEFDLAEAPEEKLRFARKGDAAFHEYRSTELSGARKFRVVWEIEWDRGGGRFHLLEISIREILPGSDVWAHPRA